MQAKELMIGDILMGHYNDGEEEFDMPVVIDGIDENSTLVNGECELSWNPLLPKHKDVEYLEDIEPIPLTEEILKANGWSKEWIYYIWCYNHKSRFLLSPDNDSFYLSITNHGVHIHYVHELQHALRLCGLNDLADNFKIE